MSIRGDLAQAHRTIAMLGLHEAVDGHISVRPDPTIPEILITPYPRHWSTITDIDIPTIRLSDGAVVSGDYVLDEPAWCVHRPLQLESKRHTVFLHAHPPAITAIACSEAGRILPMHQSLLSMYNDIAYFDSYDGEVNTLSYGKKIADALGTKSILLLANHGVITAGGSLSKALKRLYYLERACELQNRVFAMGLKPRMMDERLFDPSSEAPDSHEPDHAERLFREWARLSPL